MKNIFTSTLNIHFTYIRGRRWDIYSLQFCHIKIPTLMQFHIQTVMKIKRSENGIYLPISLKVLNILLSHACSKRTICL